MDDELPPQLERPPPSVLLAQWHDFFADPLLSLSVLKSKAVQGEISSLGLRSLYWRFFFSLLPSPAPLSASTTSTYAIVLARSRSEYAELSARYLRSPDGGLVNDGESDNSAVTSPNGNLNRNGTSPIVPLDSPGLGVQVNNPLSLDSDNPWQSWFADLELRKTIRQDVQRTFPEIEFFRSTQVQDKMTNLLFIFCKLNPDLSYRQGLHELLAPLLWTVDYDSLPPTSSLDSLPHLVLARDYIEHDTWTLFSSLMKSAKVLYDFTPSVPLPIDRTSASSSTTSLTLNTSANHGSAASTVLVQPIVGKAIRIHDGLLQTIDHECWLALEKLKIEPQLYSIRWLRLLFGREFPIADTLLIWDGLFAEDPSLRIMEYFSVAMLLRIRDAVVTSDYSGVLQLLLRFPSPSDGDNRVSLLIRQAVFLRDNVSASAGDQCRQQNEALHATAGVSNHDPEWARAGSVMRRGAGSPGHKKSASVAPDRATAVAALLAEGGGLVGELAKGVYGRAEALGLNRALFGTFNDIKRGANQVVQNSSEIRQPWDRPASPARDYVGEIARMRASNLAMSKALTLCVDVLEKNLTAQPSTAQEDEGPSPLMATTALKHIRDVLAGQASKYDPNVLSPLLRPVETFPIPARSPELSTTSPSVSPTVPTTNLAPPAATASSTSMGRTLSSDSSGGASPAETAPSTSRRDSTSSSSRSAYPSINRPLPARPIPPWESQRLGTARLNSSSSPPLPRLPPSASVGRPPPPAKEEQERPLPTFPPTSFTIRSPPTKSSGFKKEHTVVADPLGAIP